MKTIKDVEFSVFSQNGEDGIILYLINNLKKRTNWLFEIGAEYGNENNSSFLIHCLNYNSVVVDMPESKAFYEHNTYDFNPTPIFVPLFVSLKNVDYTLTKLPFMNIDFASVDIDGNDYYIVKRLLQLGLKPSIFCVEYNYAFGPDAQCRLKYAEDFTRGNLESEAPKHIHSVIKKHSYGCSLAMWRTLFKRFGYEFFSVCSSGVNAFFYDPNKLNTLNVEPIEFSNNTAFHTERRDWPELLEILTTHCGEHIDFGDLTAEDSPS